VESVDNLLPESSASNPANAGQESRAEAQKLAMMIVEGYNSLPDDLKKWVALHVEMAIIRPSLDPFNPFGGL
jgi:hypothetical protein